MQKLEQRFTIYIISGFPGAVKYADADFCGIFRFCGGYACFQAGPLL